MKIDNFALTTFQACPIKYKLRIKEGWTKRGKSGALGFGGALHEGLAMWYKTHDMQKSLVAITESWPTGLPADDWRTREKCLQVMLEYIKQYPQEAFRVVGFPDNPMVECTFTLDTGMFLRCEQCAVADTSDYHDAFCSSCKEQKEPIEYGGIFDGLVEHSGTVFVLEHKTTSQLGSYYFNQFKPNNQVTGYVWAAGLLSGQRVGGAFINAIGIYKASKTKFERQITTRAPVAIEEWLNNVRVTCEMIRECERTGHWPMFTGACTMYGACEYHPVHVLNTETERSKMLEQEYVLSEWAYEQRAGVKEE